MSDPLYKSIDELIKQFQTGVGKKFSDLDINHRLTGIGRKDKGVLGKIVEEGVFHYSVNSRPEADFANLGIELKTSGILRTRNGVSFKERVPLNNLNYRTVKEQTFEDSDMWHKCQKLFFALYEYLEGKDYGDMSLIASFLHKFSEADIEVMKRDYKIIRDKILNGEAHTISETDTNYLAACTAGSGHGKLDSYAREVNLPVKQRKFALKNGYMTEVVRRLFTNEDIESIVKASELKERSLEEIILGRINPYIGKTETQLKEMFNVTAKSKTRYERYIAGMLGVSGQVNKTDEFIKGGFEFKTVRIESNGKIEQNMSFPYFDFKEIVNQEWEDSDFYQLLAGRKYLFAIFKNNGQEYVFDRIKMWHIPDNILNEEGYKVFNELKNILLSGNIVRGFKTQKNGKVIRLNNFPKSASNPYFHVRPHAEDREDACDLPVPDKLTGLTAYTKQCFWIKKEYILSVLKEN